MLSISLFIFYDILYSCKIESLYINIFINDLDDESDTATEGEEDIKAREIRKQEVCLRIPDISTATTDTGSDTEVIFLTPELIDNNTTSVCINKCENDNAIPNEANISSSSMSQSLLNTNRHTNAILNDIYNSDKSTNSCLSLDNRTNKIPSLEKHDVSLNGIIMTNENKNNINNMSDSLYYECEMDKDTNSNLKDNKNSTKKLMNRKQEIFSSNNNKHCEVVTSELENYEHSLDYPKCSKKQKQLNQSIKINDDCKIEDSGDNNIQLNSVINDPNVSETAVVRVKNYSKPIKLNVVTTEPYPKYTPTVEKAIRKYEDKQPKKECIVM